MDDVDPLEDLLLSDEDSPERFLSHHHIVNESDLNEISNKEKKKKIIAELFGKVDDEWKPGEIPASATPSVPAKKSDWLQLKVDDADATVEAINPAKRVYSLTSSATESRSDISQETGAVERRHSSPVNDRTDKPTDKLSNNLRQSKLRFKSLDSDLLDFESPSTALRSNRMPEESKHLYASNTAAAEEHSAVIETNKNDNGQGINSYIPSRNISRRLASNQLRGIRSEEPSWLSSFILDDSRESASSSNVKANSVPTWLKAEKDVASKPNTASDRHQKATNSALESFDAQKVRPADLKIESEGATPVGHEYEITSDAVNASDEDSDRNKLEEGNAGTPSLSVLKRKQVELKHLVKNQKESVTLLEQEIQNAAVRLLQEQQDNTRALLQIISFDRLADGFHTSDGKRPKSVDITSELQMRLNKQDLEKAELEMKLKYSERKHAMDLVMLEDLYKCKLRVAEEKEEYYVKEIQSLEDEFREKLMKRKEEENVLIRAFNAKLTALQEEHVAEVKHMIELQSLKNPRKFFAYPTADPQIPTTACKELALREIAVEEKYKELSLLEDSLNRQKQSLDGKEINLNTRIEEFELRIAKEKLHVEAQKREVKLAQNMLEEKRACFQQDLQREKNQLASCKQELEIMKKELLDKEGDLMKEKFQTCAERARIEAIMNAEGEGASVLDIIQNRAELQGTVDELRKLKSRLVSEREEVKTEQLRLKEERWRLKEIEQELGLQRKNFEKILRESETRREEGADALKKARQIESQLEERIREMEKRVIELNQNEALLTREKLEVSREKDLLMRKRCQLEMMLPQLSYEEQMPFNLLNKNIFDPRVTFMELLAKSTPVNN